VLITPPGSYELKGKAKPRPEAPPELRNALQMLGPATPDGEHDLTVAGSF
jgi:Type II secretion system (T2SS), protein N